MCVCVCSVFRKRARARVRRVCKERERKERRKKERRKRERRKRGGRGRERGKKKKDSLAFPCSEKKKTLHLAIFSHAPSLTRPTPRRVASRSPWTRHGSIILPSINLDYTKTTKQPLPGSVEEVPLSVRVGQGGGCQKRSTTTKTFFSSTFRFSSHSFAPFNLPPTSSSCFSLSVVVLSFSNSSHRMQSKKRKRPARGN